MIKKYLEFINENKVKHWLYHGSSHKFDIFDFDKLGGDGHPMSFLGVHFSEDEKIAENFINPPDYILYEVEISYNKFLIIKEGELVKNMIKYALDNKIIDQSIFTDDILSLSYHMGFQKPTDRCITKSLISLPYKDSKKMSLEYKKILISKGFDCIKYINEIESPEIERYDWIVFNPEQIKIIESWSSKPELK